MRRKKLANKIVSILMAGMMVVSTPMSALATDAGFQDSEQQIAVQTVSEDGESLEEYDDLTEEDVDEEITSDEDTTADEDVISEDFFGGQNDTSEDEELILGDYEDSDEAVATQEADEDSVVGKSPAEDAEVSVTISVKGGFAKAKNDSLMVQKKVTVKDLDSNGKLTIDEALEATHEAYYNGGAAAGYKTAVSEEYGTYLEKLWGDESGAFGYWDNDKPNNRLDDEVKAGDNIIAFVYKDTENYSDVYTRFEQTEYDGESDSPFTVELEKARWDNNNVVFENLDGAILSAYDSSFQELSEEACIIDGYNITFAYSGTYYLIASGTDAMNLVPSVSRVTVKGKTFVPATGITLSKSSASIIVGSGTSLRATVAPNNATEIVSWSSSAPDIATVDEYGYVRGIKIGTAEITATAGSVSAKCNVTVKMTPVIADIKLYRTQSDYTTGKGQPLEFTPTFQSGQYTGYTLTENIPDYTRTLYAVATLTQETINSSKMTSILFSNTSGGWSGKIASKGLAQNAVAFPQGYISIYTGIRENQYLIDVPRYATLSDLKVVGELDQAFDKDKTSYHAYVDKNAEGVTVTAIGKDPDYTIKANGIEITAGEAYIVPYNWDANGKMTVSVEVGRDGLVSHTYTIEAEPYIEEDTPRFITQPKSADYIEGDTAQKLSFVATANGKLAYQWYSNTENKNTGGTIIVNATEATYQPSIEKDGVTYYYCVITNTEREEKNTATSDVACITVDKNPTPIATFENPGTVLNEYGNIGYIYSEGDAAAPLKVKVTSQVEGGTWSYSWIQGRKENYSGGGIVSQESSFTPSTENVANNNGWYYYCEVTYTYKGKHYSTYATTGMDEDTHVKNKNSVFVFVETNVVKTPVIRTQPEDAVYTKGDVAKEIWVSATNSDYGELTYQWYENDVESTENGTLIEGATAAGYVPDIQSAGIKYYYCIITNTLQGNKASTISRAAKVTVYSLEEIIESKLSGKGTQEDPYQIKTAEDYTYIAEVVAKGISFDGKYLKQINNITLPRGWKPIGVTKDGSINIKNGANLYAFSGYLDGNGKTVSIPNEGLPLLGYVKGAEVHNLKIYGKKIAGYGLANNFEGVGLSGSAIIIDNVTLKSGSQTLKSGLIGANITTNGFAGCSNGFVATIRNCTIERGVVVGYNKDQDMIGSIAGRMQGTVENCISYATVYGKSYVGGIIGTRDNAVGVSKVKNCTFAGTLEASGDHVGGIVGGGYSNASAPNGAKLSIDRCASTGKIIGSDKVGGILGGDSYVLQTWENVKNTFKGNSFTGKVEATNGTFVGGIIGYYASLDAYDGIANNYYAKDCGAEKGIGFVASVDTSCPTHETESGASYVETGSFSRTDDPLGVDANKLTNNDGLKLYVEELQVSGKYRDTFYLEEKINLDGIKIKAVYSDGTEKDLSWEDVAIKGYDNTSKGEQKLTLEYEDAIANIIVKVLADPGSEPLHVSCLVLGDTKHGSNEECHTLDAANLPSVWAQPDTYTVDVNATVYDVLKEAAEKYNFTMYDENTQYGTYIYAVEYNNVYLKEKDNGVNSGWMYTVNGEHSLITVAKKYLEDGDVIILHYTDDYTKEDSTPDNIAQVRDTMLYIKDVDRLTLQDQAAIEAARKAYNALTEEEKAGISEALLKKLEAAEEKMAGLTHAHEWGSGTITTPATCITAGVRAYTCKCGETKTEAIPAAGHQYGAWTTTTEATVFAPAAQTRTCSVCGTTETQNVGSALQPTIKVNATTVPLKVKQKTSAFKVTGLANGDSVQSYKSGNTKIFTVTKSGVLKAGKKTGKATLTITLASGLQKKVTVRVQKKTVTTSRITGLQKKVTLKKGTKLALKPSLTPITSTQKFTYSSSNKKIVTVNKKGVITAKKAGKAKITVKSGKKKYTVTVTVTK